MSSSVVKINNHPNWNILFQPDQPADQLKKVAKKALFSAKADAQHKWQAAKILCSKEERYSDKELGIALNWGGEKQAIIFHRTEKENEIFLQEGSNGTVYQVNADLVTETEVKTIEVAKKVFHNLKALTSAKTGASILDWIWSWYPKNQSSQIIRPPVTIEESQYFDLYEGDLSTLYERLDPKDLPFKTIYQSLAASAEALDRLGTEGTLYFDYKGENLLFKLKDGELAFGFPMTDFDGVVRIPTKEEDQISDVLDVLTDNYKKARESPSSPAAEADGKSFIIIPQDEWKGLTELIKSALAEKNAKEQLNLFGQAVDKTKKIQAFIFGIALIDTFLNFAQDPDLQIDDCFKAGDVGAVGFSVDSLRLAIEEVGGQKLFSLIQQLTYFSPDQRTTLRHAIGALQELADLKDRKRKR